MTAQRAAPASRPSTAMDRIHTGVEGDGGKAFCMAWADILRVMRMVSMRCAKRVGEMMHRVCQISQEPLVYDRGPDA